MHNGLTENWTYNNSRMQPLSVAASKGSSTLLTLDTWYCAGASPAQDCATNNGNIMQAWAGPNATPAYKQTFGYDSLNRLSSATEGAPWAQSYGYDIYGNRWATGTGPGIDSTTPSTSAWYDVTTNHMVNALLPVAYDDAGAGNLKTLSGYLFSYDGENRMVRSTLNGIDTNYAYDGDGRRVQKTGVNSTTFVYDARGALAAEYSTQAPPVAGTEYVTVDHLGSTRLTTNASGNPIAYHDYVPFGAEIPAGVNGRSNLYGAADGMNKKFTGQYRDTETQSSAMTSGLDFFGARYFSGAQGRFTSADSARWIEWQHGNADDRRRFDRHLSDPQQFNLYAYTRNNPLRFTDPTGLYTCKGAGDNCAALESALKRAAEALNSKDMSSRKKGAIQDVLTFYGKPTDKNGVTVTFGAQKPGAGGQTSTVGKDTNISLPGDFASKSVDMNAERTIHEGVHGIDDRGGTSGTTRAAVYADEMHAYTVQSYVPEGLGTVSRWGLWDPAWLSPLSPPDFAEVLRSVGIEKSAAASTEIDCARGACKQ